VDHLLDLISEGDISNILVAAVPNGFWQDDQYYTFCPFHEDQDYSFSYQKVTRTWRCNAACGDGDLLALGVRLWNCGVDAATEKLLSLCPGEPARVARRYPYLDANGQFAFEIVRYIPKNFERRIPVAWIWKDVIGRAEEQDRILYRLPEVLVAPEVVIA